MPAPDTANLQPDVGTALGLALDELRRNGIKATVTSAYRSTAHQAELYANRASNPFPVAPPGTSVHETGRAVDLALANEGQRSQANTILAKYGFGRWGGTFKRADPVHYEYTGTGAGAPPSLAATPAQLRRQATPTADAVPTLADFAAAGKPQGGPTLADFAAAGQPKSAATGAVPTLADFAAAGKRKPPKAARTVALPPPSSVRPGRIDLTTPAPPPIKLRPHAPTRADLNAMTLESAGIPTTPGLGQLGGLLTGITAADNATNAALAHVAQQVHRQGAGALLSGQTYTGAADKGIHSLTHPKIAVPPTAIRDLIGMQRGKTGRFPYDVAAVADYALGGLLAPSNALLGPTAEVLGPPIRAGIGRVAAPLLERAGKAVAESVPGLAKAGNLLGENLGIGKTAATLREVTRPYRMLLQDRLHSASQIGRDVRAATISARLADPVFDQTEQAFAAHAGGASRLQTLVSQYAVEPQAALRRAAAAGVDPALVKQFGDRIVTHADETLSQLAAHGRVKSVTQGGPLFRPGSPERNQFLAGYADQIFGRPAGTTLGTAAVDATARGGIKEVHDAALAHLTDTIAQDGRYAAPVVQGQPLRPDWVQIPQNPRFGSLAGQQVPSVLSRFLLHEVAPQTASGNASQLQQLGQIALKGWRTAVRGTKQMTLTLNPAGLVSSTGARVLAAEIATKRAGVPVIRLTNMFGSAGKEWYQFLRTGQMSADIHELVQQTPAFLAHFGTQVGEGEAGVARAAGTSGTVRRIAGKAVHVHPAGQVIDNFLNSGGYLHGALDQLVKLSLYKALKPKLGAAAAAVQVEKHLFDFSDQGALLEAANRFGVLPFNAYPVKATGLLMRTLVERPDLIARYPRLQRQLLADMPGAQQQYENLAPYQKGPTTLPLGGGKFANFGRVLPFGEQLGMIGETGGGEGAGLPGQGQTPVDKALTHVLFGPALGAMGMNRDIRTGKPIAPPGTPPGQSLPQQFDFAQESLNPPLVRGLKRVGAALTGTTLSHSRYGEAQTPGASLSQGLLNVPIYSGEGQAEKETRLGPSVETRAERAGQFVDRLDESLAAGKPGFPELADYRRSVAQMQPFGLKKTLNDARGLLKTNLLDPTNFDAHGQLSAEGEAKLRRLYTYIFALGERMDAQPEAP